LLIHFLRDQLNITGPHIGCETSHCGACTVDLDGKSVSPALCSRCRRTAPTSAPSRAWRTPTAHCTRCRFNFLTLREPEYWLTSSPRVPLAIS
jgi:hypothetical protein